MKHAVITSMSLREHYSGQALQGLLTSQNALVPQENFAYWAKLAVQAADALIAELNKKETDNG